MTVMIAEFFGLPHSVVRNGKWRRLGGFAAKLYGFLWYESERLRTRELTLTTRQLIAQGTGGSRNTIAGSVRELVAAGLITAEYFGPKGYVFVLCDPETGKPWRSSHTDTIAYVPKKKAKPKIIPPKLGNSSVAGVAFPYGWNTVEVQEQVCEAPPTSSGISWEKIGIG